MRRAVSTELLDEDRGSAGEVARSLAELRIVNRLFGGVSTTTGLLRRACARRSLTGASVLDVGSGSGDAVLGAAERLAREGVGIRATLLDRRASHLPRAAHAHLEGTVEADALSLPFPDSSFDLVACSLFVHHLEPPQVALFAREALRVARHALVINDLSRSRTLLALVTIGLPVFSHMTSHDGIVSARRAYTPAEMNEMLRGVGSGLELSRHYLGRMGVIVWK
jgi:SAM-dependent methyltransferase